jgi:sortase A
MRKAKSIFKHLLKFKYIYLIIIAALFFASILIFGKDTPAIFSTTNFISNKKSSTDFELSISKLNLTAPILLGVDPADKEKYNAELTKGVAHMNGTALPGEKGNVFIYGHSSSEIKSPYDKIFAKLNDLTDGDKIEIKYKGKKVSYTVSGKKIVEKDDMSVLEQTDERILTLMTCWPLGTSDKRLIVIAKQD